MNDYHECADGLLAQIADRARVLGGWESELAEKIETLRAEYAAHIAPLSEGLKELEKSLISLMKKNTNEFFTDEVDRLDLDHGALLHKVLKRVVKSKKVTTDALEKLGYDEAVKIVKSVNWDEIEKWSDVRLAEVGTERKQKETFEYEIFDRG
jgi:phage host-nuclease inhibitor protein Gam